MSRHCAFLRAENTSLPAKIIISVSRYIHKVLNILVSYISIFNCILRNLTYTLRLSQATVIVWNYEEGTMMGSYETHKVGVEDLCFTCNGDFLVSLGGRDDGNVIVWDVQKNSLICGILFGNVRDFFLCKINTDPRPCEIRKSRIFEDIEFSNSIFRESMEPISIIRTYNNV